MAATSISSRRCTGERKAFVFSQEVAVIELTRLILSSGFDLNFGANLAFVRFFQTMNPNSTKVRRRTVIKRAKLKFGQMKKELRLNFASLTPKIALACDVWRNANRLEFIRITAHWIDTDSTMQRRVINFKGLEFPLDSGNIADCILNSINAWGIRNRICSITFDDTTYRVDVMEKLKIGINPNSDRKVFRVRCVCRIINLCVQDGLKVFKELILKIGEGISLFYNKYEGYSELCKKYGLKAKKLPFDDNRNWDSTRKMLKECLPYKDVMNEFIASEWSGDESVKISEQDWEVASVFCRLLDVFYDATDYASRNYQPSSCGILLHLVNTAKIFSECRENVGIQEKISVMYERFLKYFHRIPKLYSVAAVMDPRIKLSGCVALMESLYQLTDNSKIDLDKEKTEVSDLLHEMHKLYASQSSKRQRPSSEPLTGSFAWSVISGNRKKTEDLPFCELTFYLQTPQEYFGNETEDFDILGWWKKHEVIYPALSILARDLLTTPVSTLAPDCAFALNKEKNILGATEFELRGRILEIYSCLRDWFNAETRTQGQREECDEDEEDEEDFDFDEEEKEKKRKTLLEVPKDLDGDDNDDDNEEEREKKRAKTLLEVPMD